MLRKTWVAAAALLLVTLAAPAYGQVKLAWKLKEGDKFYLEDASTLKQKAGVLDQKFEENITTTMVTEYEVKKVTGDTVLLKQTFLDVTVNYKGGLIEVAKFMEKLEGKAFEVTIKGNKVTKFDGFDKFVKDLAAGNDATEKMVKQILTEDLVRQSTEETFGALPDKEVKKGESWNRDAKVPLGPMGTFKTASVYTYEGKSKKGDGEEISLKGTMSYEAPKGDGAAFTGQFRVVKGNLRGDSTSGTMVFNADLGRLVRYEMKTSYRGTLTLDVNGNQVELDIASEQQTTSRVLKDNPLKK